MLCLGNAGSHYRAKFTQDCLSAMLSSVLPLSRLDLQKDNRKPSMTRSKEVTSQQK